MATSDSLGVAAVRWNHRALVETSEASGVEALLDRADHLALQFQRYRSKIASLGALELSVMLRELADIVECLERAGAAVYMDFAVDVSNPVAGAAMAKLQERATATSNQLLFFDLEWAALSDDAAENHLSSTELSWCAHWLRVKRSGRPYLLSEQEEKVAAEKNVTGVAAWTRLFDEQTASITVDLGGDRGSTSLEVALSELQSSDRLKRLATAEAITTGLGPGLRTRAYIYNVLLSDKSIDDRLRTYDTWSSSRNLANQASNESVTALVEAVVGRYDLVRRWYALKAKLLGLDRLHFADRNATLTIGADNEPVPWSEAKSLVVDSFTSFSPRIGSMALEFFDRNWIDAPAVSGKQGGAFCMPTVPGTNPYVFVNYTGTRNDVLTLAHELGHGVHFQFSQGAQPVFQTQMPLTVAETASVFGETVTFSRILQSTTDPAVRLNLLASSLDAAVVTVFRQVSMFRFEDACHNARRATGELSVEAINEHWLSAQRELFGDTVDVTGYESWWSYVGHFVHVPGYVYAYAFGQLLATSVFERFLESGPSFVPKYEAMLAAGGSRSPEALAAMVNCDLRDPAFWSNGLSLIERTLNEAEAVARLVVPDLVGRN